jgi:hypothetical protein
MFDLRIWRERQSPIEADSRVVNQSIGRAEIFSNLLDEVWNALDLAEIKWYEMEPSRLRLTNGVGEFAGFFPGNRNDTITCARQPTSYPQAQPAASTCDDDVIHFGASPFRTR